MQAIFGPKSDQIKHDMAKIISGEITKPSETTIDEEVSDECTCGRYCRNKIYAPGHGEIIPLSEVPDKVFSKR